MNAPWAGMRRLPETERPVQACLDSRGAHGPSERTNLAPLLLKGQVGPSVFPAMAAVVRASPSSAGSRWQESLAPSLSHPAPAAAAGPWSEQSLELLSGVFQFLKLIELSILKTQLLLSDLHVVPSRAVLIFSGSVLGSRLLSGGS